MPRSSRRPSRRWTRTGCRRCSRTAVPVAVGCVRHAVRLGRGRRQVGVGRVPPPCGPSGPAVARAEVVADRDAAAPGVVVLQRVQAQSLVSAGPDAEGTAGPTVGDRREVRAAPAEGTEVDRVDVLPGGDVGAARHGPALGERPSVGVLRLPGQRGGGVGDEGGSDTSSTVRPGTPAHGHSGRVLGHPQRSSLLIRIAPPASPGRALVSVRRTREPRIASKVISVRLSEAVAQSVFAPVTGTYA